jgi:DNA-binding NtrC family response regulator
MARLLLATEDIAVQNLLKDALAPHHELEWVPDKSTLLKKLNKTIYELILVDMELAHGMELLESFLSLAPMVPVIALGTNRAEVVVEAVKKGAYDFLVKPIPGERAAHSVGKALQNKSFRGEIDYLRRQQDVIYDLDRIIARSPKMKMAMGIIRKICKTVSTIAMTGETGTGKSFLAGAIHFNSERKQMPFVTINCANLPESLLESELFGHEKGSFTGATKTRIGRFEQANGGTVFLDEIGDLGPALQSKLLRFLEEKTFERLGGNKTLHSDVRIIVATNKQLEHEISKGRFREDLYYRVNVINIHLPPFRERMEDIEELSSYFLKKHCRTIKKDIRRLDPAVLDLFKRYQWPGNLRELSNVIERAVLLSEGSMIKKEHVLFSRAASSFEPDRRNEQRRQSLVDIERESIIDALEKCLWVQKDAAEQLGISKRALNYKIKRLGIKHARWRKNRQ